jgi:hypothetical protein
MGSNIKIAAERLYKIADELEKEASDNTFFVCDGCNHTASLSDINLKRKLASSTFNVKHVANVTVNDSVTCVACGGKMSYVPTENSGKYYVEAEDTGADIFEGDTAEETPETAVTSETPENTDAEPALEEPAPADPTPEESPATEDYDTNPVGDATSEETPALEDKSEETPALEDKSQMGDGASDGEDSSVVEETVTEDTVSEDTPENTPEDMSAEVPSDVPTDGTGDETPDAEEKADLKEKGIDLPKNDVPKFEKIPKDAQDAFWRSVAKYDI